MSNQSEFLNYGVHGGAIRRWMSNQDEKLITLKSGLSEHEILVLDIELDRQRKSTGVTYGLWLFLSWLGLHKFYLGRIKAGVRYVIASWVLILLYFRWFFFLTRIAAEFSLERHFLETHFMVAASFAKWFLLPLCAHGIWWLMDLFTIPGQVRAYNESLEMKIIASLNAGRDAGRSPWDYRPTWPERGAERSEPRRMRPSMNWVECFWWILFLLLLLYIYTIAVVLILE